MRSGSGVLHLVVFLFMVGGDGQERGDRGDVLVPMITTCRRSQTAAVVLVDH
jgi:hypothetical protein